MNTFEICLVESVNGIAFGSDRAAVRAVLGNDFTEFKKSKFSKNTTDDFGSCHVFYAVDNTLVAIEIFSGATICANGQDISLKCPELINWVKQLDPDAEEDSDGIVSKKLSIGIYAPHQEFESILFGKKEYYR